MEDIRTKPNPKLPKIKTYGSYNFLSNEEKTCKYPEAALGELIEDFITYAPYLDQLLALAPKHLKESETDMFKYNILDDEEATFARIRYLNHLISVKRKILKELEKEDVVVKPKFDFYRGNPVQVLLDDNLTKTQKINYLQCMPSHRVDALILLVQGIQCTEFVNLCPWSTEKNYLLVYSIFHFYGRDIVPVYYFIQYYAELLNIFATGKFRWSGAEIIDLQWRVRNFDNPIYVFPTNKELLKYMVLNKEAHANKTDEEKRLVQLFESIETSIEFKQKGDTYKPLANYFFILPPA